MSKALVVNYFSGPGARKSTLAAHVFAELKWLNINCELVTEYAKDMVWNETTKVLENQVYVFGKQYNRIYRVARHVDILVTDSPFVLSIVYDSKKSDHLKNLVLEKYNEFDNLNFFVLRCALYNPKGRMHNEEEAKLKDAEVLSMLNDNKIPFTAIRGERESVSRVVDIILKHKEKQNAKT